MKLSPLCLLLAVGVAHAEDVDPKAAAAARYLELAESLKREGKLAEACAQYEFAFKASAADQTLDELSRCYRALTIELITDKQDSSSVCRRIISDASVSPSKEANIVVAECHSARADALLDAKEFANACEAAEAAVAVVGSVEKLVFAAGCYRDAGRLGRSWRRLLDARTKLQTSPNAELDRLIVELASAVRPGRVIVTIPTIADVVVDDEPITRHGLSIAGADPDKDLHGTIGHPLDAGRHTVKVTVAGNPTIERVITIVDGNLERVVIELPGATPPPPITTAPSSRRKIGWITLAASSAVGLVGLYLGYDAFTKQSDADVLCPTGMSCSQDAVDLNDRAGRAANVSNVLVGTALVGAALGTYLVLTAPKPRERSTRLAPAAGPTAIGLSISGGF